MRLEMSFKDIIKAASQDTSKPVSQDTGMPVENADQPAPQKERMVNITVKVPVSHRDYWAVESAKKRLPVAQVVKRALAAEFGLPDDEQN